ncbi:MAG: GDSL-type esterase/lipase family protein, partial [Planctomycetota bacterium]
MPNRLNIMDNEKLLFMGDSITDCECRGLAKPLGYGYVQLLDSLITVCEPQLSYEFVNKGVAGDTILDMKNRWETDLIAEKPDTIFIMIGVNDVLNRHLDEKKHLAVSDEVYETTYRDLLQTTQERIHPRHIVLMEPTCLEFP